MGDILAPAAAAAAPTVHTAVLELRVRNHPGTMSHVTGLFARRAFNLEAIVCAPVGDGSTSTMLLLVADEPRLEQVERQLAKLHDVMSLRHRPDITPDFFARVVGNAAGTK
jgi:acetolactate synthase-1/3 small subunit